MSRMTLAIATVCMLFASSRSSGRGFGGRQGDMWYGGSFSYNSFGAKLHGYSFDRVNTVELSPIVRYFPADNFILGPKLSWKGTFMKKQKINGFGFGLETGIVFNGEMIPYLLTSPQGSFITSSYEEFSGYEQPLEGTDKDLMFILPLSVGVIIPFSNSIGIQLEFGVQWGFLDDVTYNQVSLGFGVCGFGGKTAVSALTSTKISDFLY